MVDRRIDWRSTDGGNPESDGADGITIPITTIIRQPVRRKLSDERQSITHKFSIAGHEGYITVGMYEDGTPGEIFLNRRRERVGVDVGLQQQPWHETLGLPQQRQQQVLAVDFGVAEAQRDRLRVVQRFLRFLGQAVRVH